MTIVQNIMTVLSNAPAPLSLQELTNAITAGDSNIDRAQVSRSVSKLMRNGRVDCSKKPGEHVKYFLTPAQMEMHARGVTKAPAAAPITRSKPGGLNGVAAIELSKRLRFLVDIGGRPAFEGSAILKEIIGDYRRALGRATGSEDAQP